MHARPSEPPGATPQAAPDDGDTQTSYPPGPLEALLSALTPPDAGHVRIVDTPEKRVRHPSDLVAIILYTLGAALVLLLTVYAQGTTIGVAEDVQGFNKLLAKLLIVPVAVLEGLATLVIPIAVLVELGVRRLGRQVIEAIAAAGLGLLLAVIASWAIRTWGSAEMIRGLSIWLHGKLEFTVPGSVAAITGLLTAAGPRTRRRTVAWSWNLLWVALGVVIITAQVSLPGIIMTVLLGRVAGFTIRYASGVLSERAYGPDLVTAVRRAGFTPSALVRVRDVTEYADPADVEPDPITEVDADGHITGSLRVDSLRHPTQDTRGELTTAADPAAVALTRAGDNRVYAMFDGVRRDVVVLDGDRQVVGFLTRFWRSLRLRGIQGRAAISLRAAAERTALLSYAATAAGVRTPQLLGIGESVDSMVLVSEHADDAVSLRDLPPERLTDAVLAEAWRQLKLSHASGLAHRDLTADVVLVSPHTTHGRPDVWLTGWEQGDIASSALARRMDLTQMVALLGLRVGAERAVASAVSVLPDDDIAAIGPLLQSVALPSATRAEMHRNSALLKELRAALVERLPQADVEPQRITRFGARTIITLTLTVIAGWVILTTANFQQIADAAKEANPWWAVAAFALGLITWVGSALTFVAFSPVKLPLFRAILTQAAASFVALAAPAGIGPAAMNLRMLTKRKVATPVAVATVALVQVSQFVVTIVLLVALSVFTGEGGLIKMPSRTVVLAVAAVAATLVATLLVPAVRTWVLSKIRPTVDQVWPRLSEMLGQPARLALGISGNIVMTLGYVFAFEAALAAFGRELSLVDAAVIYLLANAAGAAVPTPGGLGGIEFALTTALTTTANVPAGIAASITLLFRLTTYWARIPIGWLAMRYLQRKGDL